MAKRQSYKKQVSLSTTVLHAGTFHQCRVLNCSGCVTSAESVLISQQSNAEVLSTIEHNLSLPPHSRASLVVSLSPQSRASIAAYYNLTIQSVYLKLHTFFTQILPFDAVFDTNLGREIALVEGAREFQSRWTAKQNGFDSPLPVINASCPGWICYAEKTHHAVLPYLSTIRSPQQLTGSLIKTMYARRRDIPQNKVWHLSVMPCFDKKLEASREDFTENGVRDVDCVITTAELVKMIGERGINLTQLEESQNLSAFETKMVSHPGSSSGGYLHHLLTVSAQSLFGMDVGVAEARGVSVRTVRNGDMVEYTLAENGQVKLRMALCYGFRNIQNLVRKLEGKGGKVVKKMGGKEEHGWDYVEVMACPSGCVNGGGQLPAPTTAERVYSPKEWLQQVEQTYQMQSTELPSEERVEALYKEWFGDQREKGLKRCVQTGYRAVEFTVGNPLLLGSRW
jgi:iron only hydrogenase large subunit-like protein